MVLAVHQVLRQGGMRQGGIGGANGHRCVLGEDLGVRGRYRGGIVAVYILDRVLHQGGMRQGRIGGANGHRCVVGEDLGVRGRYRGGIVAVYILDRVLHQGGMRQGRIGAANGNGCHNREEIIGSVQEQRGKGRDTIEGNRVGKGTQVQYIRGIY